jgi:FkbM family methyltransferase
MMYRRGRLARHSLLSRNPLASAQNRLTFHQEWRSVSGLLRAKRFVPRQLEKQADCEHWQTVLGDLWTPPGVNDHYLGMLGNEVFSGVYTAGDTSLLKPGAIVIDGGANIGAFSRYALQSGAAYVVAVEPSPGTASCLRKNLAEGISSSRATVIEKGLWNEPGELSFSSDCASNPGAHHVSETASTGSTIQVTTIDMLVEELKLERVDFIKMDIEGAELRALDGGAKVIQRYRPVCAIATEHTEDLFLNTKRVIEWFSSLNLDYRFVCSELHPYVSASSGKVLCPYTVVLTPNP